ncbi:hypothetical protein GN244_ATG10669 [Phytophthora infestans]|uniref:RxLR effector protein n=1 Tax=Phytophthora infestans TaxID=4787 RepID=A0A833TA97_PHYIN|nr:hypothetical protein GN244_ATG10669 [Phytophthora infestans]
MCSFQVLVVTLVLLLTSSEAANGPSKISTLPSRELSLSSKPVTPSQRRSLRIDTISDEDSSERGALKSTKAYLWAEFGASDDYVRKALKLTALDDTAVRSNKYYAAYANRAEYLKITKWLQE